MSWKRLLGWPCLLIGLLLPGLSSRADVDKDAVEGLRAYLARFRRSSYFLEERNHVIEAKGYPKGYLRRESTLRVTKDGERVKTTRTTILRSLRKGKEAVHRYGEEQIGLPALSLSLSLESQTNRTVGIRAIRRAPRPEMDLDNHGGAIPFLNGFVPGYGPILEEFGRSEILAEPAMLGSHRVVMLTGTGSAGVVRVWLDPARGYVPLRLVLTQDGESRLADGPRFKEIPEDIGGPYHSCETVVETLQVDQRQGQHIAAQFEMTEKKEIGRQKKRLSSRTVFSLKEIVFDPGFTEDSFRPTFPIDNGMIVSVEGEDAISYEWRDGEIVKAINRDSVSALEGQSFKKNAGWLFWTLLGIAAILGGGGLWWLTRRRSISEAAP